MGRIQYGPGQPPVYRQLAGLLRKDIRDGRYRPGAMLPSEQTLAGEYELGVDTVRDALAALRTEGLIETKRGQGSWVRATPDPVQVWFGKGTIVRARMPSEDERGRLDIPEGVPLLVIRTPEGERTLRADRHEVGFGDNGED